MSDEKDFKTKFKKSTEDTVRKNTKKLGPVSDKDIDILKGDPSESSSNSFAKNVQAAVKGLKRDFNNYKKAKNRDEAKVKK